MSCILESFLLKITVVLALGVFLAYPKESKSTNKQHKDQYSHKTKIYGNMSYTYADEVVRTPVIATFVQPLNYCSFFNNRAPSPQVNLKNCTWYKENSCCLQAEIESTFSKVKPLIGSSKTCQLYLNSLMCYICAPNQFKFYGKERLTVCREFCDKMFNACGDAILKGSKINEIYSSGEEFCQGRRYNIGYLKKDNCFSYNAESLEVSSSNFFHSSTIFLFFFSTTIYYFIISMHV